MKDTKPWGKGTCWKIIAFIRNSQITFLGEKYVGGEKKTQKENTVLYSFVQAKLFQLWATWSGWDLSLFWEGLTTDLLKPLSTWIVSVRTELLLICANESVDVFQSLQTVWVGHLSLRMFTTSMQYSEVIQRPTRMARWTFESNLLGEKMGLWQWWYYITSCNING